jgi:anti-sigma B factor antagonist
MMQVTQEIRDGWRIVTVRGRVDSETADELETSLQAAVAQDGKVVVDFAGVTYVSSAGLRALIQGARAAEVKSSEFVVCSPGPSVKRVFDMSGMEHIMKVQGKLPC